jgi:N-acetylmuramoyl-L-alanine amidase
MVVRSKMWDRGIKRARFVVIRDIAIPGVLIEGGFQTNQNDAKLIATPAYRQQLATAMVQAVQNYRRAVGTQAAPVVVQRTLPVPPEPVAEEPRVITPTAN